MTIIVTVPHILSVEQSEYLRDSLSHVFPDEKVMVADGGIQVSETSSDQLIEAIKAQTESIERLISEFNKAYRKALPQEPTENLSGYQPKAKEGAAIAPPPGPE